MFFSNSSKFLIINHLWVELMNDMQWVQCSTSSMELILQLGGVVNLRWPGVPRWQGQTLQSIQTLRDKRVSCITAMRLTTPVLLDTITSRLYSSRLSVRLMENSVMSIQSVKVRLNICFMGKVKFYKCTRLLKNLTYVHTKLKMTKNAIRSYMFCIIRNCR